MKRHKPKMEFWFRLLVAVALVLSAMRCSPVKAYQKMYLNDSEMELAGRKVQKFEMNFQLYREGAAGANGGKSGGGCGCN
jgi:hypothetical protein